MSKTIRFDHNKNGQKVAYKNIYRHGCRWVRMSLKEAEMVQATGTAKAIYHGKNQWSPEAKMIAKWTDVKGVANYKYA